MAQVSGGLYLLQLAYKLWRSGAAPVAAQHTSMSKALAFRTGFITSALNPKLPYFMAVCFATRLTSATWRQYGECGADVSAGNSAALA